MKKIFFILTALFVLTLSFCNKEKKSLSNPVISASVPIVYDTNEFVIEGTDLIEYKGNSTDVIIPKGVITIKHTAFMNNQLYNITIPNSVTSIGLYAFEDTDLTDITIGENVSITNGWQDEDYGDDLYYEGFFWSFPFEFDRYYIDNGSQAGTYVYKNRSWSKSK